MHEAGAYLSLRLKVLVCYHQRAQCKSKYGIVVKCTFITTHMY